MHWYSVNFYSEIPDTVVEGLWGPVPVHRLAGNCKIWRLCLFMFTRRRFEIHIRSHFVFGWDARSLLPPFTHAAKRVVRSWSFRRCGRQLHRLACHRNACLWGCRSWFAHSGWNSHCGSATSRALLTVGVSHAQQLTFWPLREAGGLREIH